MGLVTMPCPRDAASALFMVTGVLSATSGLERALLAEETAGTKAQDDYEQDVHRHHRPLGGVAARDPDRHAHEQPREDRAPEAADPAEHDDEKRGDDGV